MWSIFTGFLSDARDALIEQALTLLQEVFGELFEGMFFIERIPGLEETPLTEGGISSALYVLYLILVLLLALKLIWKGIKVYILWRDGESETPPGEMLLGAAFALVTAVAFPVLYELAVTVTREILDTVGGALLRGVPQWWEDDLISQAIPFLQQPSGSNIAVLILTLIFVIQLIALYFVFLWQGAQTLIYRLGVPLAAIGLADSDGGCWKPYCQTLFRLLATGLIRYFCLYLGVLLVVSLETMGLILGIVFEVMSFSTPKILSQFLIPQGGSGFTQKVNTIVMTVRAFGGA